KPTSTFYARHGDLFAKTLLFLLLTFLSLKSYEYREDWMRRWRSVRASGVYRWRSWKAMGTSLRSREKDSG
ncbi:MAG: hypothetical protein AAGJ31_03075, partial [Verrucomicrobiota bacterium]